MTAGAIWICQHHNRHVAEGSECPWCVVEERDLAEAIVRSAREALDKHKSDIPKKVFNALANALNP